MSEALERKLTARRQAELVARLRRLSRPAEPSSSAADGAPAEPQPESCDLCGNDIPADHRHLLHLVDRRILCACESCVALRGGDPELCPTGTRVVWLDQLELSDELWAAFGIPIGLAFLFDSSGAGGTVAFYPSPVGATECELDLDAWDQLCRVNPELCALEPDAEALIVNRLADPPQHVIAPIDECYRLVGIVKRSWEGISGGAGSEAAIAGFFSELRERSA